MGLESYRELKKYKKMKNPDRNAVSQLEELPNIGKAIALPSSGVIISMTLADSESLLFNIFILSFYL